MREKRSKDDFQISNKNRIKIQKKQRDNPLRNNKPPPKSLMESPQNSDDEEYQSKIVNRGSQWWTKVQNRFFREVPSHQMEQLMERLTSEELLELRHPSPELNDYFTQRITTKNPYLGSPCFLRVLFRRQVKLERWQRYELITYAFKEYDYVREPCGIMSDRAIHLSSFRTPTMEDREKLQPQGLSRLELDIIDVEDSQDEVRRLLQHDVVNAQTGEQIDREIKLWQAELGAYHAVSVGNWKEMLSRAQTVELGLGLGFHDVEEQIAEIRKELRMTEVLLYFKRGHSDKTERMLEDAMEVSLIKQLSLNEQLRKKRGTKLQKLKCLFETDCKICFCTESDDKNKVLYCDACNTSFHQACYGVETIDEKQKFYCQVCLYIRANTILPQKQKEKDNKDRQQDKNKQKEKEPNNSPPKTIRKPSCLLCCKPNFPMRRFSGHFYHITCLVLFDLVQIRDYCIQFRQGLTPNAILHRVVENQLISGPCAFCHKETGMKFSCSYGQTGCSQHFHPICAYLNGVHFELVRHYHSLKVTLSCPEHHPSRDTLNQIYLRRFFCDYKGTSNKTDVQFQVQYKKQIQEREIGLELKMKEAVLGGIKKKGKNCKAYKCSQRSRPDPSLTLRRQASEARSSNPISDDLTQTRRILRLMSSSRNE